MSADLCSFYQLRIALLYFNKNTEQKAVALGPTIVAYFPFSYSDEKKDIRKKKKWALKIASLHDCIIVVVEQRAECALKELFSKMYDKWSPLLHLMIASHVADLPESKDLLSVKRGNQTFKPCHICKTNRRDFVGFTTGQQKCWSKTKAALKRTENATDKKQENLRDLERI